MPSSNEHLVAGRYELVALAGEGGMAVVWRAIQHGAAGFTRQVAAKKIKPAYQAIQNYINMFVEEARVGSDIAHPHIVQIHDFVIDNKAYYLIMEWVEGTDFGKLVRSFLRAHLPVPWKLVTTAAIDALRGLAAAHERRRPDGSLAPVIHRDVSPQNILIGENGISKLTDFGLARARDRVSSLTAPGTVKGKLTYLPPEVTYGRASTPMSDIFSMGNVLWEALAGRRLFRGASDLETFTLIRKCQVPPLAQRRPDVPVRLAEAVHRALALEPEERFLSARDMARELAAVIHETDWSDDLRLELGAVVKQIRSPDGISAEWWNQAQRARETRKAAALQATSLLDVSGASVEFSSPSKPGAEATVAGAAGEDTPAEPRASAGKRARKRARKPAARKTDSIDIEFSTEMDSSETPADESEG